MESQLPEAIRQRIESCGVVAVLIIERVEDAVPVAQALLDGGVTAMELTLRTPVAIDALRVIRQEVPDMLAGIGTILTPHQVQEVVAAGASFGVSPGTNPRVIQEAQQAGLPFAPGVATPSDVEVALELGCRELKFFPAEPSGGLPYLKSMAAPYFHLGVKFIPLGGVNANNLETYLGDPCIAAVGGSWLAPPARIAAQDFDGIREQAQTAAAKVQAIRQGHTA